MARSHKKKKAHAKVSNQNGAPPAKNNPASRIPRSMVLRMGGRSVGPSVSQLALDVRAIMEPHTASRLRERKTNKLRDFAVMAGPLGVSHLILFYRAEKSGNVNMKLAVHPRGPTLTFRVEQYSLCRDVAKSQRRPKQGGAGLDHVNPPLLVMNNFMSPETPKSSKTNEKSTGSAIPRHLESLTTSVFQSLFPTLSPQSTPLSTIRRVMLVNREISSSQPSIDPNASQESNSPYILNLRHYAISSKPVRTLSRGVRRLEKAEANARHHPSKSQPERNGGTSKRSKGALPDLGKLQDVADYILEPGGYSSASETEVDTDAEVEVAETLPKRIIHNRKWRERQRLLAQGKLGPHTTPNGTKANSTSKDIDSADEDDEDRTRNPDSDEDDDQSDDADENANISTQPQRVQKRALKLTELGPRLRLRLNKVEEGLCSGKVLWHELIHKSAAEEKALDKAWEEKRRVKEERRRKQKEDVERKRRERGAAKGDGEGGGDGEEEDDEEWEGDGDDLVEEWSDMDVDDGEQEEEDDEE